MTIREWPGIERFRFWQEGGGYDRNLWTEAAVLAVIEYIHLNPVRRGLCDQAIQWTWSSAGHYYKDDSFADPDLPRIPRLPAEFFTEPEP